MKRALVIGRAKSVWDEIAQAKALLAPVNFDYTICVGPVVVDYPGEVDAWAWFHVELFAEIGDRRIRKGYSPIRSYWTNTPARGVRAATFRSGLSSLAIPVQYVPCHGGSSGLLAVVLALTHYSCEKVVLAGIPMTAEGGQYDSDKLWPEAKHHTKAWMERIGELTHRVKSFSGWTRAVLGEPTREWLQQDWRPDDVDKLLVPGESQGA